MLSSYSQAFLVDFFPSLIGFLQTSFPGHFSDPSCQLTEIQANLWVNGRNAYEFGIRNPTLLPIQIFGAITGFFGFATIKDLMNVPSPRLISFSFLYFCCMNLVSIIAHNLSTRHSVVWRWASILDVAFTGASALCIAASALELFRSGGKKQSHLSSSSIGSRDSAALPGAILLICLAASALGNVFSVPWTFEAVYLGSMALAAVVAGSRLHRLFPKGSIVDYLITVLGVSMIGLSGLSDGLLFCKVFPQEAYFTSVHLIFLGSDITFLGLHRYVMSSSAASDNRVAAKSNID